MADLTPCIWEAQRQSGFAADSDIIFCQQFFADDYSQVFLIAFLMYLIYLGMYFLPFALYGRFANLINEAKSTITTREGRENLRVTMDETHELDAELGRYHGMPFTIYLLLYAVLSLIYLLIKLLLVIDPFDHSIDNRYQHVNDRFQTSGFQSFVTAETILLTYVLSHNLSSVSHISKAYWSRKGFFGTCTNVFLLLSVSVIWIDCAVSVALLCWKWSLALFLLYEVGIAVLVAMLLMATCCLTLFCFLGCMTLNASMCSRCTDRFESNRCEQFAVSLGAAVIVAVFGYLVLSLLIALLFACVGGPSYSLIYLNADDPTHVLVLWLFAIAAMVGVTSVFIGGLYGCLHPKHHKPLPNQDD